MRKSEARAHWRGGFTHALSCSTSVQSWGRLSLLNARKYQMLLTQSLKFQSGLDLTAHYYIDYRITKWLRLEGTSGGHLVQSPCSSRKVI